MKKGIRMAAVLFGALVLAMMAGCGDVAFEPEASGIYVDRDGAVRSAEIESFDNSAFEEPRYDEAELKTFVEDSVIAYNQAKGAAAAAYTEELEEKDAVLPVSVEKMEIKEAVAELILDYQTTGDYLAFNEADDTITALEVQTAPSAVGAGVSLDGLVNPKGETVDATKAKTNEKYIVLTITGNTTAVVNGKIAGASGDITIQDEHTVAVSGSAVVLFR